jgi:hypothetical protein
MDENLLAGLVTVKFAGGRSGWSPMADTTGGSVRTERSELADGKREDLHLGAATTLRVVPGHSSGSAPWMRASRTAQRPTFGGILARTNESAPTPRQENAFLPPGLATR